MIYLIFKNDLIAPNFQYLFEKIIKQHKMPFYFILNEIFILMINMV